MAKKPSIYQIVDSHTNAVEVEGFANRQSAKPKRDEMNAGSSDPNRYIVSRGKDHPRGPSFGPDNSQQKRYRTRKRGS